MTHQTETAITNSLLKNPNYFNLTTNQTVDLTTEITQFNSVPAIFSNILGGYIYDLLGRRFPIFIMLFLQGACISLYPETSPNQNLYVIAKIICGFFNTPLDHKPLINDTV